MSREDYGDVDLDDGREKSGDDKTSKRRQQNNEAARRFRAKRKVEVTRLRKEAEEYKERERKYVTLLEQVKRFLYTQNVPLNKFPPLREIEHAIAKYQQLVPEVDVTAIDSVMRSDPPMPSISGMLAAPQPPDSVPGSTSSSSSQMPALYSQVEQVSKQMIHMENRILQRLDLLIRSDGDMERDKRPRYTEL